MVDDDTVVSPTRGRSYGDVLGSITYSTGAVLTGAFGSDVGVYIGGPESPLNRFSGWVWGTSSPTPQPRDGVFEWNNGNSFAGSIIGDGSESRGVFTEAGAGRRFVGTIDLSQVDARPVRGQVESGSGELLAVVRSDD